MITPSTSLRDPTELDVNKITFQTLGWGGGKGPTRFGGCAVQAGSSTPSVDCISGQEESSQATCLFWCIPPRASGWGSIWELIQNSWYLKRRSNLCSDSDNVSSLSNLSGVALVTLNFEEMMWPENSNFIECAGLSWQEPAPHVVPNQAFRNAPPCLRRNRSQATANGWEVCSTGS